MDRRPRRGKDRFLHVRVGLFFVAASFLLTGMALSLRWPAVVAALIAAAGLLMRFAPPAEDPGGWRDREYEQAEEEEAEEDEDVRRG